MVSIYSLAVAMLLQVILATPSLSTSNETAFSDSAVLLQPRKQLAKRMSHDVHASYTECAICLDDKGEATCKWNGCPHQFHVDCIDTWRNGGDQRHTKCPICQHVDPVLHERYMQRQRSLQQRIEFENRSRSRSERGSSLGTQCPYCNSSTMELRSTTYGHRLHCARCNRMRPR
ncbi:hypothetical protein PGT21_008944 [Puccinia graminis f. sp. tritici]|uniref:RING-type domain-containing protein n=1 Tax=Puccinia graminis f. sp. tritici TaxID=56615 RepID=A0A5B0M673_PUCGR|nr:hypothetical protein PGT21_008944 [Puccinia graminis f. sp. tritici]